MEQQPPIAQPPVSQPDATGSGRSKKRIALIGCGAILGLCVLIVIASALLAGDDDDDDVGDAAPAATSASLGSQPTSATESDEAEETITPPEQSEAADPTTTEAAGETPTVAATTAPEPTATTAAPTPTAAAVGTGRSNPVPFGEVGIAGDWEIQVLEVIRGDEAYDRILEANQFNEPAPPGMEYVLVNARVKYNGNATEAQSVDFSWFNATGDARVRWPWASVVEPTPELDADLFNGGEVTGWTTVLARQGETNLVLIFEPLVSVDEGDEAFLALEPGATVQPLTERLAEENDLGFDRQNPVPLGERVVGDTWEIWVIESIRGEEALARIKEANMFNEDPQPGMEYVLVRVGARNVKPDDGSDHIWEFAFRMTGDAGRVYDNPSIVDPEPALDYEVYAGGEVEGWITVQAAVGEQNLRLVYEPPFSFTGDPRYFAIE